MTTIDFQTLPTNFPSLCIPRVLNNIDEEYILNTFQKLNLGSIERIDIVSKSNFNRVYIHFSSWYSNVNADKVREILINGNINGKEVKIIYDAPWFWKVSAYKKQ